MFSMPCCLLLSSFFLVLFLFCFGLFFVSSLFMTFCPFFTQARLRTTSMILQRWLATWIVLILFWSTYYLLYWIDHDATILDMIIFFVPLVLLPVLVSGPTEVNGEGHRVPRVSYWGFILTLGETTPPPFFFFFCPFT